MLDDSASRSRGLGKATATGALGFWLERARHGWHPAGAGAVLSSDEPASAQSRAASQFFGEDGAITWPRHRRN